MWKANEAALLQLLPRLPSFLPLQDTVLRFIADAPRQLAYPGGWRVMGDSDRKVFFIRERGRATLSGGELKLDNVVFTMVSSEIEIPP
jgi:hypothetical protein